MRMGWFEANQNTRGGSVKNIPAENLTIPFNPRLLGDGMWERFSFHRGSPEGQCLRAAQVGLLFTFLSLQLAPCFCGVTSA